MTPASSETDGGEFTPFSDAPAVSIVLLSYNYARFLPDALDGICKQTFSDWEIIGIDDASSDESPRLLEEFASKVGARCRVFLHETNAGCSRRYNEALEIARGQYVTFLSADDVWVPERLARQVEALASAPEAELCHGDLEVIDAGGRVLRTLRNVPVSQALVSWFAYTRGTPVWTPTVMIRNHRWRFSEELEVFADVDLWLRILSSAPAVHIPTSLVRWREHAGNLSRGGRARRDRQRFLRKIRRDYSLASIFPPPLIMWGSWSRRHCVARALTQSAASCALQGAWSLAAGDCTRILKVLLAHPLERSGCVEQIEGGIDLPAAGSVSRSSLPIAGWAVSRAARISSVRVFLGRTLLGEAHYGFSRPDVVATLPHVSEKACGFGGTFSTFSGKVRPGRRRLRVLVQDSAGSQCELERWIRVEREASRTVWGRLRMLFGAHPVIEGWLDLPPAHKECRSPLEVGGWAFSKAGRIESVAVFLDGQELGEAIYGWLRLDVVAARPHSPNDGCGFTARFPIDVEAAGAGPRKLLVRVADSAGNTLDFERPITLCETSPGGMTSLTEPVSIEIEVLMDRIRDEIRRSSVATAARGDTDSVASEEMHGEAATAPVVAEGASAEIRDSIILQRSGRDQAGRISGSTAPTFEFRPGTTDEAICRAVCVDNEYRLPRNFAPEDVVVDVGAHIGSFIWAVLSRGAKRVHAYEAEPGNFGQARQAVDRLGPCVLLEHLAVWRSDREGEKLSMTPYEKVGGMVNTGSPSAVCFAPAPDREISSIALDRVLESATEGGRARLRLLKLDCEGSEYPILYTARKLHLIDAVCGEYHNLERTLGDVPEQVKVNGFDGYDGLALARFLQGAGFVVEILPRGDLLGLFFARRPESNFQFE